MKRNKFNIGDHVFYIYDSTFSICDKENNNIILLTGGKFYRLGSMIITNICLHGSGYIIYSTRRKKNPVKEEMIFKDIKKAEKKLALMNAKLGIGTKVFSKLIQNQIDERKAMYILNPDKYAPCALIQHIDPFILN